LADSGATGYVFLNSRCALEAAKSLQAPLLPLSSPCNVKAEFFDSFRQDYGGAAFDKWFSRKADETAYVCHQGNDLVAFLYLKVEGADENYNDIEPRFAPKRRLKIGTFKVEMNGFKLGERFLKIIFDNALRQNADEIYVTIFQNTAGQQRLVRLLQDFGFVEHGTKTGAFGTELVLVRSMRKSFDAASPALTFPFISLGTRAHIVPIWPDYHTDLLPDSILRNHQFQRRTSPVLPRPLRYS
jgi:hypothetical protein